MSTGECRCKRFVALDGKDKETTPDRATGFVLAEVDRPIHRGSAPKAEKVQRELRKRGEAKR